MDFLLHIFLVAFSRIYPYIHNHFISYVLFLGLCLILAKGIYTFINNTKKSKSGLTQLFRLCLIIGEGLLIVFIAWFVLIHFHTFRLIPA